MAKTEQMLRTVLVMQAEILGRLESIENRLNSSGTPAEDHLHAVAGRRPAPAYEDPRTNAIFELDGFTRTEEWHNLDAAVDDLIEQVSQRSRSSS